MSDFVNFIKSIFLLGGCVLAGIIISFGISAYAQLVEPILNERFATSTLDNSQIEQVLITEAAIQGLHKKLDMILDYQIRTHNL